MRDSFVTGAITHSKLGTKRSMKAARIRSARGLSISQNRKTASSTSTSNETRMRRTGAA